MSVTFHEDAHPNNSLMVNAVITHTAGPNPSKLSETAASAKLPTSGLYTKKLLRADTTEQVVAQAVAAINAKGGQEGHVVTTTNDSGSQDIVCCVYSWGAIWEAQLLEQMRPAGCCSIF